MHDQAFSAENFRRIWDLRTRRGEDLTLLFPDLRQEINRGKRIKDRIREDSACDTETKSQLRAELTQHGLRREELLSAGLEAVSERINDRVDAGDFSIRIVPGPLVGGKPTFRLATTDAESYFASRMVQSNLRTAFDLKPTSRTLIAEQFLRSLDDETPKVVARTDIRDFFESIPHQKLLDLLRARGGLSRTSFRFVVGLLEEYGSLTGKGEGLPRGLGLSAVLAEAYLGQLDDQLARFTGVVFWARYVDDIVVVSNSIGRELLRGELRRIIHSLGLRMNAVKTKYVVVEKGMRPQAVNFLGYEYRLDGKNAALNMSIQRFERYKLRLALAFEKYDATARSGRPFQLLRNRVRFLTGNTKLSNNKRQALVGVFFSNELLPATCSRLTKLDRYYLDLVANSSASESEKTLLAQFSFVSGFRKRTFATFTWKEMSRIVAVWKHV